MSAPSQQEHEFRASGRPGRGYGRGSFNQRRNSFKNSPAVSGENRRRSDDVEAGSERKTIGNASEELKDVSAKVDYSRPRRVSSTAKSPERTSENRPSVVAYEVPNRRNCDGQQQQHRGSGGGRRGTFSGRYSRGDHRPSRRPRASAAGGFQRGENGRRSYERQQTPSAKSNDVTGNMSGERRESDSTAQVQEHRTAGSAAAGANFNLKEILPANAEEEKQMLRLAIEQSQLLEDERMALMDADRAMGMLNITENEEPATSKKQVVREEFPPLSTTSSSSSRPKVDDSKEPSKVLTKDDKPPVELDAGATKTPPGTSPEAATLQDWSLLGAKPKGTVSVPRPSLVIGRGTSAVTNARALGSFLKLSANVAANAPASHQQQEGQFSDSGSSADEAVEVIENDDNRLVPLPVADQLAAFSRTEDGRQFEHSLPADKQDGNCCAPEVLTSHATRTLDVVDTATPIYVSQLEDQMEKPIDLHLSDDCPEQEVLSPLDGPASPVSVYDSKSLPLPEHQQQVIYGYTDVRLMEQQRHLDEQTSLQHHHHQQQQQMLGGISQILVGFCPMPGGGGYPIGLTYPLMRPSFQPVMTVTPDGQYIQASQHSGMPFEFGHLMNRIQDYPGSHHQADLQEHQQQHSPVEVYQNLPGDGNALLPTPPTPLFVHSELSADALPFSPRHSPAMPVYQTYCNNSRYKPRRGGVGAGPGLRMNRHFSLSRGYTRSNDDSSRSAISFTHQASSQRGQYNQSPFNIVTQHMRNYQNHEQYEVDSQTQQHFQQQQQQQLQQQQQQQQLNHMYTGVSFNSYPQQHPNLRRYRHPYQE